MTEQYYQQLRKAMAKANNLRGRITDAKASVAKWTRIEDALIRNLQHDKAKGPRICLEKALVTLEKVRKEFADFKLPEETPTDRLCATKP